MLVVAELEVIEEEVFRSSMHPPQENETFAPLSPVGVVIDPPDTKDEMS